MKCQLQNWLDTGGKQEIPLKVKIKNVLKKLPFFLYIINRLRGRQKDSQKSAKIHVAPEQEVLGLKPGEWVEVRSAEQIKETLDEKGGFDRAIFMHGMWKYCGKQFQVFKRIEKILDYKNSKMWRVRNSVIFDGVFCENDPTELYDCDQTCFYYWKEAWLKRIAKPDTTEK